MGVGKINKYLSIFKAMFQKNDIHELLICMYTVIYMCLLIIVLPLISLLSESLSLNCNYCIVLLPHAPYILWSEWNK